MQTFVQYWRFYYYLHLNSRNLCYTSENVKVALIQQQINQLPREILPELNSRVARSLFIFSHEITRLWAIVAENKVGDYVKGNTFQKHDSYFWSWWWWWWCGGGKGGTHLSH